MLSEEILLQFEGDSQRNSISFETFILNLLKFHIENQKKKFISIEAERGFGDAFVMEGFDNFMGKTLIEIKYDLNRIPPRLLVERIISRHIKDEHLHDSKNLIIVSFRMVLKRIAEKVTEEFNILYPKMKVEIWGPNEVNKIVNKHKKQAQTIANNLFSLRLENAVANDVGDWKKEQEARIEILKEMYERGQFSLFLGAGVSSSAGMPDWNTLLNSLFVSYLTKEFNDNANISDDDINQIVSRLNEIDEPSALMAARYLRKGLSKEVSEIKEFTKAISENLYKLRNSDKDLNSDLIIAITNLCMPRRTGAKVHSVVNYNFDDLIERQLNAKSINYHSIYTDNETYDPDELPVYHVHGFLPENAILYEGLEKSTLVFSEEGYHQIYAEPYHWSNLVQLTNLRENNCLMIGLSMTDPNLRRLLDIAARNIGHSKHFAFMRRMTIETFAFPQGRNQAGTSLIKNIKAAEQFLNRHHKLNEEIMKELGVSILWFNDFDEIPKILNEIKLH